jgi:hypothetical protein
MPRQPRRSPASAGDLPWRHAGAGPIRGLRKTKFKNANYFNYTWRMRWKPDGKTCRLLRCTRNLPRRVLPQMKTKPKCPSEDFLIPENHL